MIKLLKRGQASNNQQLKNPIEDLRRRNLQFQILQETKTGCCSIPKKIIAEEKKQESKTGTKPHKVKRYVDY